MLAEPAKADRKPKRPLFRRSGRKLAAALKLKQDFRFDYKDVELVKRFLSDTGKIQPRRLTGLSALQQRSLAVAVKRARMIALLPFSARTA